MARGGIYKSEVIRARDRLLAMGRHPSIDAVRQELGNTGSKATIHRYLKEIEEEEGGKAGSKVAISESLQDLVARLAERLNIEADARIAELTTKHANELAEQRQAHEAIQDEAANLRKALEKAQSELADEQARHQRTADRLQQEVTAHAMATQQVTDFGDRLRAEEEHRRSLEEKHTHAREALEHFRAAAKEQREQDQRQHEQQIQYLQGEVKALNQSLSQKQQESVQSNRENARLTGELARAETVLHDAKVELRALEGVREELASTQQQSDSLGRRVVELESSLLNLSEKAAALETVNFQDKTKIQQLEVALAVAQSATSMQDQIAEKIRALLSAEAANKAAPSATE